MLPSSSALAGSSSASTSSDTYEQTLHAALTGGVLTQDEYETKMKVHRQSTAPLAVATRPYGDGVVAKYDWLPAAGPFTTKTLDQNVSACIIGIAKLIFSILYLGIPCPPLVSHSEFFSGKVSDTSDTR